MALPRGPQRRTESQRKKHLDASVVPVELALLARAAELEQRAKSTIDSAKYRLYAHDQAEVDDEDES